MTSQRIRIEVSNGIGELILNKPERRNALNDAATDEMGQAVEDVAADDDIRVLVLTGAGQAFCAGGDLDALLA